MIYGEMWSDYANVLCGLVSELLPFFNVHTKLLQIYVKTEVVSQNIVLNIPSGTTLPYFISWEYLCHSTTFYSTR